VRRSKSWIAILAITVAATALTAAALPQKAEATSLKGKLNAAKRALRHSNHRLSVARAALAAAIAAATDPGLATDPVPTPSATPSETPTATPSDTPTATPTAEATTAAIVVTLTVDELRARVVKVRRAVRIWKHRVQRLARQYRFKLRMAEWERRGKWMPIIKVAAAKYDVKADGMYRMMMRESGGQRYAGSSSPYKGLFQYYTGTWAASWNPYRSDSIYDGSSQIFATACAISKGMGPQMWTTTFASQY
jgi:soluble lytic murein transglycosylase-like protein